MKLLERLAEQRLAQAAQEGVFEDLPGRGLPLEPEENPFGGAWSLAHHLLRSNGFAPRWIELDKEIRAERIALRRQLSQLCVYVGRDRESRLHRQLKDRIENHNRRVQLRNQLAPFSVRPRMLLRPERELERDRRR